jgi:hypothetical protein
MQACAVLEFNTQSRNTSHVLWPSETNFFESFELFFELAPKTNPFWGYCLSRVPWAATAITIDLVSDSFWYLYRGDEDELKVIECF